MIENAKSPDGKIYAIPKVYKSPCAYGALCTKEVLDNYGSNKINTYADFIDLIDSNINTGHRLNVNLSLYQLLDIYLQDASMIRLIGNTIFDRNTKTVSYLEDTEIPDAVFNQYKEYCDMDIIACDGERQADDDIYVTGYVNYKSINGYNRVPYYAKTAKDHSLLLIGGKNNDLYFWDSMTATAIFTTSQQTERALMLLSLLNSGNNEFIDILQFGVEGKHYKKTQDNKVDLLEVGLLFWGESLLNFDSDAVNSFSIEENAEAWNYCMSNEKITEIIPGMPNDKVFQMFRYMPENIKRLVVQRPGLSPVTVSKYFQTDEGVNALLAEMHDSRDEELLDWINGYLNLN